MLPTLLTRRRMIAATAAAAGVGAGIRRAETAPAGGMLRGPTMGTTYALTLPRLPAGLDPTRCRRAIEAALDGVDRRMSGWRTDSEISRFNAEQRTGWVAVSPDTAAVVAEAIAVGRMTGGAFDVTAAPLVTLWGFGPARPRTTPPAADDVARARNVTGLRHLAVRRSPPALAKAVPSLALDLSGLAKGYAVDRVASRLEELGVVDYLVEIGGEVRARGRNRQGKIWTLGVERPEPGGRGVYRRIVVASGGIATSGDYRSRFASGGRTYSHIIDPRTGRPVTHDLASATVAAATAMRADALATAFMVLGYEGGQRLARREGLAVLLIRRRAGGFEEWASLAFKPYLME